MLSPFFALRRALVPALFLFLVTACGQEDPAAEVQFGADAVRKMPVSSEVEFPELAEFVGSASCQGCHADQAAGWQGSHHDRAMEPASETSVLAPFDGRTLRDFDRSWRFFRDGAAFVAELSEPGTKTQRLVIESTFGVYPLQQFLVEQDRGRRQVLPVAWDARDAEQGGQRWFSMHPNEEIPVGDPLHWEEPAYNWNSQCAACHSTGIEKAYDVEADTFETRFQEIDVGCEACHGPGAHHLEWVEAGAGGRREATLEPDRSAGFRVGFESWNPDLWQRAEGQSIAFRRHPSTAKTSQVEVCAPCHSRRSQLVSNPGVGDAFLDGYAPQLIEPGLYFDDGQIRDEVYVWGSFVQSRMFQAGVVCSDCHDPHSLELRREGNALCGGCHDSQVFDAAGHRGHAASAKEFGCIECHMPEHLYMEVDDRRDHSFPLPSPIRSEALSAPNACESCHAGRSAEWASRSISLWREDAGIPQRWPDRLVVDGRARSDAERFLETALDPAVPAIVRGSAWARYAELGQGAPPLDVLRERLAQAEPLESLGLIALGRRLAAPVRASLLRPLLEHDRRAVRIAAAEALADVPADFWSASDRAILARTLREYRAAQNTNAERAEAQVNLGVLAMGAGDAATARQAYVRAIERAPYFVPAHVNFADLERAEGNDGESVTHLEKALTLDPAAVWVRYALGLAHYRAGDREKASRELKRAATEAPDAPRLQLGWALVLDADGKREEAIEVLASAIDRGAADAELWQALITLLRDSGRRSEALLRARSWLEANPSEAGARALVNELEGAS